MKKVYYLATCATCQRIMKELEIGEEFEQQNIKEAPITEAQLDQLKELSGSYESLFSRVARKYRELGLKEQTLGEEDYKRFILQEYTFLKRPVFVVDDAIFIGNSKKNLAQLANRLRS